MPSHLIKQMLSATNIVTRLFHVEVRPRHAASLTAALAVCTTANQFQPAVLVYRCLHRTTPSYSLTNSTSRLLSRPVSISALIRHHRCHLTYRLSTIGNRAFPVAASWLWNTLLQNVTSAPPLTVSICPKDLSHQSFLFPPISCSARSVTRHFRQYNLFVTYILTEVMQSIA